MICDFIDYRDKSNGYLKGEIVQKRQLGLVSYMQHGIFLSQKVLWRIPGKTFKVSYEMHLIEILICISYVG